MVMMFAVEYNVRCAWFRDACFSFSLGCLHDIVCDIVITEWPPRKLYLFWTSNPLNHPSILTLVSLLKIHSRLYHALLCRTILSLTCCWNVNWLWTHRTSTGTPRTHTHEVACGEGIALLTFYTEEWISRPHFWTYTGDSCRVVAPVAHSVYSTTQGTILSETDLPESVHSVSYV